MRRVAHHLRIVGSIVLTAIAAAAASGRPAFAAGEEAELEKIAVRRTALLDQMTGALGRDDARAFTAAEDQLVPLRAQVEWVRGIQQRHPKGGGKPFTIAILEAEVAKLTKDLASLRAQDVTLGQTEGPQTKSVRETIAIIENSRIPWMRERLDKAISHRADLTKIGINTYDELIAERERLDREQAARLAKEPRLKGWLAEYMRLGDRSKELEDKIAGRGATWRLAGPPDADPTEEVRIPKGEPGSGDYSAGRASAEKLEHIEHSSGEHWRFFADISGVPEKVEAGKTYDVVIYAKAHFTTGARPGRRFGKFDFESSGWIVNKGEGLSTQGFELWNVTEKDAELTVTYRLAPPTHGRGRLSFTCFLWNCPVAVTWHWVRD